MQRGGNYGFRKGRKLEENYRDVDISFTFPNFWVISIFYVQWPILVKRHRQGICQWLQCQPQIQPLQSSILIPIFLPWDPDTHASPSHYIQLRPSASPVSPSEMRKPGESCRGRCVVGRGRKYESIVAVTAGRWQPCSAIILAFLVNLYLLLFILLPSLLSSDTDPKVFWELERSRHERKKTFLPQEGEPWPNQQQVLDFFFGGGKEIKSSDVWGGGVLMVLGMSI